MTYGSATIGDLVNKDTDGDGVPDWEEPLWGLDPTKKETTPGIPDGVAIEKMKADQGPSAGAAAGNTQGPENLTQTDKFSRELFSTVAATTQSGSLDQATVDKISSSLADNIQNSTPRKVFTISDIKVIKDDSVQAVKKYNDMMDSIHAKYPVKGSAIDILQKFLADGNNVDTSALLELDPIIKSIQGIIDGVVKMSVPQSLASLHLDFLNGLERVEENLNDIRLYDSDPIVALSGISQFDQNNTLLESSVTNLKNAINQKLKN